MACSGNVGFSPQQSGLGDTYVTISDLLAHANYTFEVEAVNGVSDLSRTQRLFAAVSITTSQAGRGEGEGGTVKSFVIALMFLLFHSHVSLNGGLFYLFL